MCDHKLQTSNGNQICSKPRQALLCIARGHVEMDPASAMQLPMDSTNQMGSLYLGGIPTLPRLACVTTRKLSFTLDFTEYYRLCGASLKIPFLTFRTISWGKVGKDVQLMRTLPASSTAGIGQVLTEDGGCLKPQQERPINEGLCSCFYG